MDGQGNGYGRALSRTLSSPGPLVPSLPLTAAFLPMGRHAAGGAARKAMKG
ncbi:hypothetical protein ACWERV_09580 [Streptomyces sp. NPDC004031]